MRTLMRTAFTAAIMLAATSCGGTPAVETAEPSGQTTLVVDNQSTLQVTVFVRRDAQRQRLGIANALTTTRLAIPDNIIFGPTALRFELQPLASRREPISEQITVTPGDQVRLIVPSTLR